MDRSREEPHPPMGYQRHGAFSPLLGGSHPTPYTPSVHSPHTSAQGTYSPIQSPPPPSSALHYSSGLPFNHQQQRLMMQHSVFGAPTTPPQPSLPSTNYYHLDPRFANHQRYQEPQQLHQNVRNLVQDVKLPKDSSFREVAALEKSSSTKSQLDHAPVIGKDTNVVVPSTDDVVKDTSFAVSQSHSLAANTTIDNDHIKPSHCTPFSSAQDEPKVDGELKKSNLSDENIKSIDLCGSQNNDNQSKNVKLKDENTSKEQDQAKEIDINQEDGDSQLDELRRQMVEISSNSKVDEDLEESETKREIENDVKHESSPPTTRKKVKNRGNTNPGIQECIECGEEFAKIQALMAHSVQMHGGIKCPHCEKRFSGRQSYNQHIKVVHSKERFPCNLCEKDFGNKASLDTHMNQHMGIQPYQCDTCDATFPGSNNLYRHKRLYCKGKNEATCPICGKGLPKKALDPHIKSHSMEKAQSFTNEEKVEAVALAKTLGVKLAADQLAVREATLHNWVKLVTNPLYCSMCGHATYCNKKLREHERRHADGFKMPTRDVFGKFSRIQSQEFDCEHCPVTCDNQAELTEHRRQVHGIDLRTIDDISTHERYKEKKAFPCTSCPKSYSSQYRLSDHLQVCNGSSSVLSNKTDPDFVNEVLALANDTSVLTAARAFKVNPSTIHTWVKNSECVEPEICSYCGQECKHKNALAKHMRRFHTDPETGAIEPKHLKERAVEYATEHSVEEAASKFRHKVCTIMRWIKLANSSLVCEFCSKAFDTQFGLDKHRTNMHMSKEDREELEESSKSGPKDTRSLKEIFEERYGRLDKDEIPMAKEVANKEKLKREEVEEDEEESLEVKEEAPSGDEMEEEEENGEQEEESDADSDYDSNAFKEEDDNSGDEDSSPLKRERPSSDDDCSLAKAAKFEISLKEEPTSDTEETNNGPPFPCEIPGCDQMFTEKSNLKAHVRNIHLGEKYDCPADDCDANYNQSSTLAAHMKKVHPNVVFEFPANQCGRNRRQTRKEARERKEKKHGCELCNFKAARKDKIGLHMKKVHGEITLGCRQCDVRVKDKGALQKHMLEVHPKTPPKHDLECPECPGKVYKNYQGLWLHTKVVHEGRMWYCDQCSASFRRPDGLQNHMESAHGTRRYQCDQCAKGNFTRKGLAGHKASAHSNNIYPCEMCGQTFTQKPNLKTHIRNIHLGERYTCPACGASYNQSSTLAAHMRMQHPGVDFPVPANQLGNFENPKPPKKHWTPKGNLAKCCKMGPCLKRDPGSMFYEEDPDPRVDPSLLYPRDPSPSPSPSKSELSDPSPY